MGSLSAKGQLSLTYLPALIFANLRVLQHPSAAAKIGADWVRHMMVGGL